MDTHLQSEVLGVDSEGVEPDGLEPPFALESPEASVYVGPGERLDGAHVETLGRGPLQIPLQGHAGDGRRMCVI